MSSHHSKKHNSSSSSEDANNNDDNIWVFAYGSLCWRPGFAYDEVRTGHVNGFTRRFWQGNVTHRGSPSKPGRVATLVPSENEQTYGCAYRIKRNQLSILEYLENREMKLGGYVCVWTAFFPSDNKSNGKQSPSSSDQRQEVEVEDDEDEDQSGDDDDDDEGIEEVSVENDDGDVVVVEDDDDEEDVDDQVDVGFPCLCYIALEGNSLWLGEDPESTIASQISEARGMCGENKDYVMNLYKYMKTNFPFLYDEHLEEIVKHL